MNSDLQRVHDYAAQVRSGELPSCRTIRLMVDRWYRDWERKDIYFNPAKFILYCRSCREQKHYKGELAGQAFEPETWQLFFAANVLGWYRTGTNVRRFTAADLVVPRKNGKALALDTDIPTPDGWKKMKDIHEGDSVFALDGSPSRVVVESQIFHKPMYLVTFEDGSEVKTSEDHVWTVCTKDSRRASKYVPRVRKKKTGYREDGWHERTTAEMFSHGFRHIRRDGKGCEYVYRVPVPDPVRYPERSLPIEPYLLGYWLGDGHSGSQKLTVSVSDWQEVESLLRCGGYATKVIQCQGGTLEVVVDWHRKGEPHSDDSFRSKLKSMNLLNNKHIPEVYMLASVDQRLRLLQGLMDTDGTCSKAGECEFVQKDETIARQVVELCSSLGIKATIKAKHARCNGKDAGIFYRVFFFCSRDFPCFRMARKRERLKEKLAPRMKAKSIVNIQPISMEPSKCIAIDHGSHLFLCGKQYTVTHNTFLAATFANFFLLFDGEAGAEVYTAAVDKAQAKICFDASKKMLEKSIFAPLIHPLRGSVEYKKADSILAPLSKETKNKDGLNPHAAICDERHAWTSNEMNDVIKTGMGARKQPMIMSITTAGLDTSLPYYKDLQIYIEVLEGIKEMDDHFIMIYQPDEGADWNDRKVWQMVNPNLGVSLSWEYMENMYAEAKLKGGSTLVSFLVKNLNMWVDAPEVWIPDDDIKACNEPKVIPEGEDCWVGIDFAAKTDVAAVSFFFPRLMAFKYLFVVPEAKVEEKKDIVDYRSWASEGWMQICPGKIIDEDWFVQTIMLEMDHYHVRHICYDPWGMWNMLGKFGKYQEVLMEFQQNIRFMSVPTKWLESATLTHSVSYLGNPVIRWMFKNIVIYRDPNDNIKLDKGKSRNKIDGVVASVDAVGGWLNDTAGKTGEIYSNHGLRTINLDDDDELDDIDDD